jgi:hypothetical protein
MVYIFSAGVFSNIIRLKIRVFLEKIILRGKYDYQKKLENIEMRILFNEIKDIIHAFYGIFIDDVKIKNPRIFLPEDFGHRESITPVGNFLSWDPDTYTPQLNGDQIKVRGPLIIYLLEKRTSILKNELIHALKSNNISPYYVRETLERVCEEMEKLQAELVVPAITLEQRLIAVFVFGPKISGDPYTDEDVKLFNIMGIPAGVIFWGSDNYKDIKETAKGMKATHETIRELLKLATNIIDPQERDEYILKYVDPLLDEIKKEKKRLVANGILDAEDFFLAPCYNWTN